jgi:hypothetical protein
MEKWRRSDLILSRSIWLQMPVLHQYAGVFMPGNVASVGRGRPEYSIKTMDASSWKKTTGCRTSYGLDLRLKSDKLGETFTLT